MNKILKVALTTIPTAMIVGAPITLLSSCGTNIPGLKDIKFFCENDNAKNYLWFDMHFDKNIKEAGTNSLISQNHVVIRTDIGIKPVRSLEGSIKVIAIDDSIYSFDWTCEATWDIRYEIPEIISVDFFHTYQIHWS